jgi:uncharacterized membrane protein
MDLGVIGALALLLIWAIAALVLEGPGWVHLLLTIGVSLLIYRIVARSSAAEKPVSPPDTTKR